MTLAHPYFLAMATKYRLECLINELRSWPPGPMHSLLFGTGLWSQQLYKVQLSCLSRCSFLRHR
jgi:hypothetical protein